MKKVLLFFSAIVLFIFQVAAQSRVVTGKVTDKNDGAPIIGANVTLKGSTRGSSTDVNGDFKMSVPESAIIVIKYVGYKTQEIAVGSKTSLAVKLEADSKQLDEVVVNIGYGTVKKEALTGSVSSVGSKELKDFPVSTAAEALAGKLAGVQVTTTEGRPGADIQIRVRGGGSITQDNSPLYIVDGVQVENALSILSPQEIQSIDVLKDVASTSIYGARGANGVVLITTKGGRDMRTTVSFDAYAGSRTIVNELEVMNPYDFVQYQYELYNKATDGLSSFENRYGKYSDIDIYKNMPFKDWQNEVFGRNAFSNTENLGIMGGTKNTTFNFSVNNTDEDGIMLNSGFRRTFASFRFDHKASDRFKMGFSARYSRQCIDGVGTSNTGSQSTNRLRNAVRYQPFEAPGQQSFIDEFDPDYANLTNLTSPVLLANNELKYDYRNDAIINSYLSYDFIKNLTLKTLFGITATDARTNTFNGAITSVARQNSNMPVAVIATGNNFTFTNSNTLAYHKTFKSNHNLDLVVGEEMYQYKSKTFNNTTKYLPVDISAEEAFAGIQKAVPPSGLIQDAPTTSESMNRLLSFFGRAMYNYKGKYLASFSLRSDGSSKFAPENRFGYFPSGQLAWRISEEDFMKNTQNWLSNLKLRLSYGTAGNNRIGDDLFNTMFGISTSSYAFEEAVTAGSGPVALSNPNVQWETTISRNAGLDFSFLNNRFNASVDYYVNNTKGLLLNAQIPPYLGYATQIQNIGKTQNKGLEVQLDGGIINSKNFRWNANFNIAFNRNKIVNLGYSPDGSLKKSYYENSGWIASSSQDFLVEVGKPIGQFYGYVTDGFYTVDDFNYDPSTKKYTIKADVPNSSVIALGSKDPQPGDLKLKKLSNSSSMMISADDRTVLGNAQPDFTGGLSQQFAYKNFDMSISMNFSYGNDVYNANNIENTTAYLYKDNNMLALMSNRWKNYDENGVKVTDPAQLAAMNAGAQYWSPSAGQYFLHSFAIEDGSFLRINNVTLGYSLPQKLLQRTKVFSRFRVYGTVNNLWTITGYSGFDPEANTRRSNPLTPSVDYAAYPRSRYILAGINVGF
ncbi:SusC/RagA family TonB-linked outer membrane protein [Pedobacter sp. HMF7647]|uniref:SusC/RagA family TonB-linked outer membrane protein n=1 Tax=Hufsiella arboris TaxID=2695275 RepID=A0A7K1Y4I9_9SPHI|nr:TonB-dependent receptor [Hufsiella arboris]MXV49497.1 SusC/RagA family TonB-linked outer membrane protein [Hufsiella arboris]